MRCAALEGLVDGTQQIVFDYEVTGSAVSSIDTGNILNGDVDGEYTFYLWMGREAGSGNNDMRLSFNGDTAGNYGTRSIYGSSTTVANISYAGLTGGLVANCSGSDRAFSMAKLYAKSGSVRLFDTMNIGRVSGTTVTEITTGSNVWSNTADNIISAQIWDTAGARISVGTRLIILKNVNLTTGTRTGILTTPYVKKCWTQIAQGSPSGVTDFTFADLDGERDVLYYMTGQIYYTPSNSQMMLRVNGDAGGNTGQQYLRAVGTSVSAVPLAADGLYLNYDYLTAGTSLSFSALIFAKSGFRERPMIVDSTLNISGTTIGELSIHGGVYNATGTSTTVSSLVLHAFQVGGITSGTLRLYALRPNG